MESWTYTFTRCSHVAVMSQPREKMQRLVQEGAIKGQEWLEGVLAAIRRDELRAMCQTAGLAVKSNGKLLTVPELQQALLAYLVSDAKKVGSCLMCNCHEVLLLFDSMVRN